MIIGGWAHQLYRMHPSARTLDYVPLTTLDADVALPTQLSVSGQNIRERVLANGFSEQRFGTIGPLRLITILERRATGFFAEFLDSSRPTSDGAGRVNRRRGKTMIAKNLALHGT